jgi:hypothetical protein
VNSTFLESAERCWFDLCYKELSLRNPNDLTQVLPKGMSAKTTFLYLMDNIFDERVYELHIGNVATAPPISKLNFLRLYNTPDPCDPTTIIGKEYALMYIPESITITRKGISLSKEDDPNDPQAPLLIIEGGATSEKTLKVAVTINNLRKLFRFPKALPSSVYACVNEEIILQHGNERIPAGWMCMRKQVIGLGDSFSNQQKLANEKGVIIPELLPRILLHFLFRVRSKDNMHAIIRQLERTSTLTNSISTSCSYDYTGQVHLVLNMCNTDAGVAVALPAEVLRP